MPSFVFYVSNKDNCALINLAVIDPPYISDPLLASELLSISAFALYFLTRLSG